MSNTNTATTVTEVSELFGAFYFQANGVLSSAYATEAEANIARSVIAGAAESTAIATAYTEYKGLSDKNAKGKINVITDFLAWVDAGSPASGAVEEVTAEVPVTTDTEAANDLDEGDDESWMKA
tara:strand:+ start:70 stop:441 length:372 start_codon:yes stop_codon:yes gene_type:complete